jgi:DNA-binding CsgD family transcriptional regulator
LLSAWVSISAPLSGGRNQHAGCRRFFDHPAVKVYTLTQGVCTASRARGIVAVKGAPRANRTGSGRRPSRLRKYSLTPREIEVLNWVAQGKSAWEVGEILRIEKKTVDEHVQTAVHKIGAVNRAHAVAIAVRDRIISL